MYLLDTDHVVILQTRAAGDFKRLVARMKRRSASDFFISIVTFHEQVLGWNAYIARAKKMTGVVRGYTQLHGLLEYFRDAQVLPFDDAAADQFEALRTQGTRVATMDLRIAAIAISRDMTVLTRNLPDFERVPALKVEDWTVT
jgi:tRNA(fMet)-specific endonuclease VapC